MPHYILLTGAGFSRNWGGWLANEAFEYLLGCPKVSSELLWRHKAQGGFEAAYDELQTEAGKPHRSVALLNEATDFSVAIRAMFGDMNKAFVSVPFEFENRTQYLILNFLVRFDAIFTLNQDLLMEQCYLNGNVTSSSSRQWSGWQMPGMRPWPGQGNPQPIDTKWSPKQRAEFVVEKNQQPFFKLHGSSNWFAEVNGEPMLIIGGNKASAIDRFDIL